MYRYCTVSMTQCVIQCVFVFVREERKCHSICFFIWIGKSRKISIAKILLHYLAFSFRHYICVQHICFQYVLRNNHLWMAKPFSAMLFLIVLHLSLCNAMIMYGFGVQWQIGPQAYDCCNISSGCEWSVMTNHMGLIKCGH